MNHKTFIGLAAATVIFTGAAAATAIFSDGPTEVAIAQDQVFPDLASNPDAAAKIFIETGQDTFSLVRGEEGWTMPEKHNYRASADDVRDLIVGLADMRYASAKTANADLYDRLDLEDPNPDGASRFVRVEGANGNVLAEAVIGKKRFQLTGDQKEGTYMRLPGDAQSWLVTGGVGVEAQLTRWLDRKIIELSADDIRRIEIIPAKSPAYVITRADAEAAFTLEADLGDRTAREGESFTRLSTSLASLNFDDVRPVTAPIVGVGTNARFVTFDGVEVTGKIVEDGDAHWATFDIEVTPPKVMPEDAASLSEKLKGWQFKLPKSAADRLTIPLEDWLTSDEGTS